MRTLALLIMLLFGGCEPKAGRNWQVESDAQPSETHPYGGFWKINARDEWGLAIGPNGANSYYVSFCGPGGCFAKGEYRRFTPIVGDPSYRVIDTNQIEVKGKNGFTRYRRSTGRQGKEFVQ